MNSTRTLRLLGFGAAGITALGGATFVYKTNHAVTLPPYKIRPDLQKCMVVATGGTSGACVRKQPEKDA